MVVTARAVPSKTPVMGHGLRRGSRGQMEQHGKGRPPRDTPCSGQMECGSTFTFKGSGARQIVGSIFSPSGWHPSSSGFAWVLKALMSTGSSAGHIHSAVHESPALHLRAIGQIEVFGQCVVLPAAEEVIASRRQIPPSH